MTRARILALPLSLALVLAVGGCAALDSTTGQRVATGAAVGAAGGAVVGAISGGFINNTLIGAAAGAAGGLVYDQFKKSQGED